MKEAENLQTAETQALNIPVVSSSVDLTGTIETTSAVTIGGTTTDTTIWKGGYVTDNFHSYYLDENMIKHYR